MEAVEPATDLTSGLRLRPLKLHSQGESQERRASDGSSNNFLEESWDDEPMTPAGRVFWEMNSLFVCVCILGFKYPIDLGKVKAHLELTLMKHKRFASRVVCSSSSLAPSKTLSLLLS
jgi:hypothetical protein